ncbi:hypothetical protein PG993_004020 [Apiospora rasikravindrae]|uniref:CCHC-type domain-containing protein n=1 Tax=Apiospora rasikravindrae TaxID=990691 RepID=A0ABR1TBK0_9PEZI
MTDETPSKKRPRGIIDAILAKSRAAAEKKRKRNAGEEVSDDEQLEDPMRPRYPNGIAKSIEDVTSMASQYAARQPDGQFPLSHVQFLRYNPHGRLLRITDHEDPRRHISRARSQAMRPSSQTPARSPSASPTTVSSASQQTEDPPKKKAKLGGCCGHCGKRGHEVESCAGPPADDGFIHACPIHNSGSHSLGDCREAKDMTLDQEYSHLVAARANLPPLHYKTCWEHIAVDHIARVGKNAVEDALPFSTDFSLTIPLERFEEYNYDDPAPEFLGHEPETANIAAFKAWYNQEIPEENDGSNSEIVIDEEGTIFEGET